MSLFGNTASNTGTSGGTGPLGSTTGGSSTQPTTSLFGSTQPSNTTTPNAQNQQQPATGGLFGSTANTNQQQQQQPATGGLFGSSTNTTTQPAATKGLFGSTNQPSTTTTTTGTNPGLTGGLFGSSTTANQVPATSGSLFGSTTANQPAAGTQTGGLFGSTATQPTGSLFGSTVPKLSLNTGATGTTGTGSLFGSGQQPQQGTTQPGSLLGGSQQQQGTTQPGSLFGGGQQQQGTPQPGSLFGGGQQQQGTTQPGSLFGGSQQQQGTAQSGSLFGGGQQQRGTTQPGSLFGGGQQQQGTTQPGPLFGGGQQQQGTTQPGPLFGGGQQQQGTTQPGSLFGGGQQQQGTPQPGSLFGGSQQQQQGVTQPGSLFGQSTTTGLGSSTLGVSALAPSRSLLSSIQPQSQDPQAQHLLTMQKIEGIYSAWNSNSPQCRFRHIFYNMVNPNEVARYTRSPNIPDDLWVKAMKENPDPKRLVPVLASSFDELRERVNGQTAQAEKHKQYITELKKRIDTLSERHATTNTARLKRLTAQQTQLQHRLVAFIQHLHLLIPAVRSSAIKPEEEQLRTQLEEIEEEVMRRGRVRGKLNELWALIGAVGAAQERGSSGRRGGDGAGGWAVVDDEGLAQIAQILSEQQSGLAHLTKVLQQELKDLNVIMGKSGRAGEET